jgi:hypothetical protein
MGAHRGATMAQIIKLLWRLDYGVSYAYLDRRGTALDALANTASNFWDTMADGAVHASYVGMTSRDGKSRMISLEPNSLNGHIEWSSGTGLASVFRDDSFRTIDRIVRELARICEIKTVARLGMRFFCIGEYSDGRKGRERTIGQVDDHLKSSAVTALGPIDDVAFIFEGTTADKVNYRAVFGPYAEKNVIQSLQSKPSEEDFKILNRADLFFDVDLFEMNLSFAEHSLFRWGETKLEKAINFIAKCSGG